MWVCVHARRNFPAHSSTSIRQFASHFNDFFPHLFAFTFIVIFICRWLFYHSALNLLHRLTSTLYSYLAVPPTVKAVNQLVGAPVESHVLLECIVEVFPKPLNGWYRNDGKLLYKSFAIFFRPTDRPTGRSTGRPANQPTSRSSSLVAFVPVRA